MRIWKSALAVSGIVVLAVVGGVSSAHAFEDSGVQVRGCPGQFGKLSAFQKGSGNSWAPGDWTGGFVNGQWSGTSTTYRWIYDSQNTGTGGGQWRNATNGDYTTLSASCSAFG